MLVIANIAKSKKNSTNRVTYLFPHHVENVIKLSCMSALEQCLITYHIQFFPTFLRIKLRQNTEEDLSVAVSFPEGIIKSLVNKSNK